VVKCACSGRIAAALAEVFDKCLDRFSAYSAFKRETESFSIIRSEKTEIPGVGRPKSYFRCGGQMRSASRVIEDVTRFKGGYPPCAILFRPRGARSE
jgi:hypothetical protein